MSDSICGQSQESLTWHEHFCVPVPSSPTLCQHMQREQFAQGLKPPSKLPLHSQHSGRQHSHSGFTPSLAPLGLRCFSSLAKCASVVASNQSFYIKFSCLESPLLLEILEIVAQMSLNCSTMKQNSSWKEQTDCGTHSSDGCEGPV